MEDWAAGLLGIVLLMLLIGLRVHIAFALASVGIAGCYFLMGGRPTAGLLGLVPYSFIASFTLTTVPLFLLMGYFSHRAGITTDVFYTARVWLSRLPGGLAIAAVAGCAMFAAVCGSSLATAALMGRVAIPEMLKYNYNRGLATGCVAAAGTIGSLIPPSILLVLYGIMTETSIGPLLIAGFLPGILSALNFMAMIWIRCLRDKSLGPTVPEKIPWHEKFASLKGTWGVGVLFLMVIGGIYLGIFTPTEAGGMGAFGAFVIALATRKLTRGNFKEALHDTVRSTSQIFAIALGAALFTNFMGVSGVPSVICKAIIDASISPLLVLLGLTLVYLFLGMFLDPIGIMLLTLPIVFPVMEGLGFDMIWFGIIMVKYLEIGLITPPVGLNVYVIKGVVGPQIPLEEMFGGIAWFVVVELVTLAMLIVFPDIALFLPNQMMGR